MVERTFSDIDDEVKLDDEEVTIGLVAAAGN